MCVCTYVPTTRKGDILGKGCHIRSNNCKYLVYVCTMTCATRKGEVKDKYRYTYVRMYILWKLQLENEHYSTVSGLVISPECFIAITPDFLCPFMNYQSHSYWQPLVIAV